MLRFFFLKIKNESVNGLSNAFHVIQLLIIFIQSWAYFRLNIQNYLWKKLPSLSDFFLVNLEGGMRTVFITQIMIHKEESLFYLWEPKIHKSGIFIINVLVPQGQMGR